MEQTAKTIKIDSYDYFGYLVPGMVAMLSFCTLIIFSSGCTEKACELLSTIVNPEKPISTVLVVCCAIIFALLSYIMGHIAATFSSMVFEKILVKKVIYYPTQHLVRTNIDDDEKWALLTKRYYYLFFITAWYMLVVFYNFQNNINTFLQPIYKDINIFRLSLVILGGWTFIKLLNATITANTSDECKPSVKCFQQVFLGLCCIFSFPMILVTLILGKLLGMRDHFPEEFAEEIRNKYNRIFPIEFDVARNTEVWWSLYWYVVNRDSIIRARIEKFLSLYGFMRNMAFACWFAAVCAAVAHNQFNAPKLIFEHLSIALLFCSVIFAVRYYYLYYNYYSKTIFRMFLYLDQVQPQEVTES